jgi:hypothetical protein
MGNRRVFGSGTPGAKPNDSCILIYEVGPNGSPDTPPGSVDDELLGTGGTDATGNFVDNTEMSGIPLSRPLRFGDAVFAYDACEGRQSAVVAVIVPAPTLSAAGLCAAIGLLMTVAFVALRRKPRRDRESPRY